LKFEKRDRLFSYSEQTGETMYKTHVEVPVARLNYDAFGAVNEVRLRPPPRDNRVAPDSTANSTDIHAERRLAPEFKSGVFALESEDAHRRRGLLWKYGGDLPRHVIQLHDFNLEQERRLEGDVLRVIVPKSSGKIINVGVKEDVIRNRVHLCVGTAKGHLFCLTFLHPRAIGGAHDDVLDRAAHSISFLCRRLEPCPVAVVSVKVEQGNDVVTCVSWENENKIALGLESGHVVLVSIRREPKTEIEEQVFKDISLTDRILGGFGFGGADNGQENILEVSICMDMLLAVYGDGILRGWSISSTRRLFAEPLAKLCRNDGDAIEVGSAVKATLRSKEIKSIGCLHVGHVCFHGAHQALFYVAGYGTVEKINVEDEGLSAATIKDFDFGTSVSINGDDIDLYTLWVKDTGRTHAVSRATVDANALFNDRAHWVHSSCNWLEEDYEFAEKEDVRIMHAASHDDIPESETHATLGEIYCERIFLPQRFSARTITTALQRCFPDNDDVQNLLHSGQSEAIFTDSIGTESGETLINRVKKIASAVSSALARNELLSRRRTAPTIDADIPSGLLSETAESVWTQLLEACLSEWRRTHVPSSMYCYTRHSEEGTDTVFGIARRELVSQFRRSTNFEKFQQNVYGDYDNDWHEFPRVTMHILMQAKRLAKIFLEETDEEIKREMEDLQNVNLGCVNEVFDINEPGVFGSRASEKLDIIIRRPVKLALGIVQACIAQISSENALTEVVRALIPTHPPDNEFRPFRSASAEQGLAAACFVRKDLQARTTACRDLCLFFAFAHRYGVLPDGTRYLNMALQLLRSYTALGWLGSVLLLPPHRRVTVALPEQLARSILGRPQNDTVVNISGELGRPVLDLWCAELGLTLSNAGEYLKYMWPKNVCDTAAEFLASHGQLSYLDRYSKLVYILTLSERSFGDIDHLEKVRFARRYTHVLGELYVGANQYDEAMKQFLEAAPLAQPAYRIQYISSVMATFEAFNKNSCVLHCARVAIASIDAMVTLDEVGLEDADGIEERQTLQVKHTQARLWYNIFEQTMILGRYDEAFVAIMSNPEESLAEDCARKLVVELSDKGQLDWLCRLPWESMRIMSSRVGLKGVEFIRDILGKQATHFPVGTGANTGYHFLYAFNIKHGSYRKAAEAMYTLSQRLLGESAAGGPDRLRSSRANALAAAANALRLLPPREAWIFDRERGSKSGEKRRREGRMVISHVGNVSTDEIVWLSQISQECVLEEARVKLRNENYRQTQPHDTVHLLLQSGAAHHAEAAATLVNAFKLPPGIIVRAKAKEYFFKRGMESIVAEIELKEYLAHFDGIETNFQLHVEVADELLSLDDRFELPTWLVLSAMGGEGALKYSLSESVSIAGGKVATGGFAKSNGNPAPLIQICLKYGRYYDACTICTSLFAEALYLIRDATGDSGLPRFEEEWIATSLVDEVLSESHAVVEDHQGTPQAKEIQDGIDRLEFAIEQYYGGVVNLDQQRKNSERNIHRHQIFTS
jgi:hypothetical protein